MSKPDANQASELFELCKQVYEVTGWKYTIGKFHDDGSYDGYVGHRGIAYTPNPQNAEWLPKTIPLYTSDYLLEKLQRWFYDMGANDFGQFDVTMLADACIVRVRSHGKEFSEQVSGDTLLLALLKLTIALSEAGELNE